MHLFAYSTLSILPHRRNMFERLSSLLRYPAALPRYASACLLTALALGLALLGEGVWGALRCTRFSSARSCSVPGSAVSGRDRRDRPRHIGGRLLLIEPIHSLTFDASRLVQLSAFIAVSGLISSLNGSRRRALDASPPSARSSRPVSRNERPSS